MITNAGYCETCARYDQSLREGMCQECRERYNVIDPPKNYNIIGIAGPAQCGKDTAADYLVRQLRGYTKVAFADPLKAMLKVGLGLTDKQLYGGIEKELIDDRYGCSARHLMTDLGTGWGRNTVHLGIWVRAMESHIQSIKSHVIIPDVRFENEAEFVRKHGVLLHIKGRGNNIDSDHESEAGVEIDTEGDVILYNNRTIDYFMRQLKSISMVCKS